MAPGEVEERIRAGLEVPTDQDDSDHQSRRRSADREGRQRRSVVEDAGVQRRRSPLPNLLQDLGPTGMIVRRLGGPFPGAEHWADQEPPEVIEMEWAGQDAIVVYRLRTTTTGRNGEREVWYAFAGSKWRERLSGLVEL